MSSETLSRPAAAAPQDHGRLPVVAGPPPGLPARLRSLSLRFPEARDPARFALVGAYCVVLAVVVAAHEPWFDEAQAWLLARDSGLVELFTERLRYEGTPGLWHLLLMGPAQAGWPYATMQVIGALCAAAGVAVLVWRSPFPLLLSAGIAASYVVGYQYAAVARSYTLAPVLLFAVAATWRRGRIEVVAGLLALLACVSLHGTLVAGALAAVRVVATARRWSELDRRDRVRHVLAAAGLLAVGIGVALVLRPPADLAGPTGWNLDTANLLRVAPRRLDESLAFQPPLTAVAVLLSALWFARTRTLALWLVPTLAVLVLFAVKYYSPWHDGWPFLVWVFALWVSLDRDDPDTVAHDTAPPAHGWLRLGALGGLAAVLVVQVGWWVQVVAFDLREPYAAGEELAAYLETLDQDTVVWTTSFHALGVVPYVDGMPFDNYHDGQLPGYWLWASPSRLAWSDQLAARERPDVIVRAVKHPDDVVWQPPAGYTTEAVLYGDLYGKGRVIEPNGFIVYERTD